MKKPLSFESVDAINVGGSYVVGADGKPVRDDGTSTSLKSIAEGAPGRASAELNAADAGATPAHSEASEKPSAKKP
ncbi:MAG: hypothetical protein V4573_17920 [Pseudomonadota bacterium]